MKIIITGASSGIGRSLALEFAKLNSDLGIIARREDLLISLKKEIEDSQIYSGKVFIKVIDSVDYKNSISGIQELIKDLGGLDKIIFNAGGSFGGPVDDDSFWGDKQTIETNLIGVIAGISAVVPHFQEKKKGHIVAISSVAATRGIPKAGSYSASKAGLKTYMDAIRNELHPFRIRVSTIYPGYIKTAIVKNHKKAPFIISLEEGVKKIFRSILKEKEEVITPSWPWSFVVLLMKFIPVKIWKRLKIR